MLKKHHITRAWVHGSWPPDDDVIKWKHFPRYYPFVRGILPSPVNSPHKGQWRQALMFSLICAGINGWINNREAGDLRRHRAHYDVTVMDKLFIKLHWTSDKLQSIVVTQGVQEYWCRICCPWITSLYHWRVCTLHRRCTKPLPKPTKQIYDPILSHHGSINATAWHRCNDLINLVGYTPGSVSCMSWTPFHRKSNSMKIDNFAIFLTCHECTDIACHVQALKRPNWMRANEISTTQKSFKK